MYVQPNIVGCSPKHFSEETQYILCFWATCHCQQKKYWVSCNSAARRIIWPVRITSTYVFICTWNLSHVDQIWISRDFLQTFQYKTSRKNVQCEQCWYMRVDGRTHMTKLIGTFRDDASRSRNKYGDSKACRKKSTVVQLITVPRVKNYSFFECVKYSPYRKY